MLSLRVGAASPASVLGQGGSPVESFGMAKLERLEFKARYLFRRRAQRNLVLRPYLRVRAGSEAPRPGSERLLPVAGRQPVPPNGQNTILPTHSGLGLYYGRTGTSYHRTGFGRAARFPAGFKLAGTRGVADPRPATRDPGRNQRPATRDTERPRPRGPTPPDIPGDIPGPARTFVSLRIGPPSLELRLLL